MGSISEIWRSSAVVDVPRLRDGLVLHVDESQIDTASLRPDVDPGRWTYRVEPSLELDDNGQQRHGVSEGLPEPRVLMVREGSEVSLELATSGLASGEYRVTATPDAGERHATSLFAFVVGSEPLRELAIGLARLQESIGDLVQHREQLEGRLQSTLGDLQEAQLLVDALEAQIKVLKAAAASNPVRRRWLARAAVDVGLPILAFAGGFHWSGEQVDATDRQTAAIIAQTASNERIAGGGKLDQLLERCWDDLLRTRADLEGVGQD